MKPHIVLIDPHGEYGRAFGDRAEVFCAYNTLAAVDGVRTALTLPYWLSSSDEFRALLIGKTEFEATSQANMVYKALTHARLVALGLIEPAKEWIGTPVKDNDPHPERPRLIDPERASEVAAFDMDWPTPFSLDEFQRHIEFEQCLRVQKNAWARVSDSEWHDGYSSVLNKLRVLRSDARVQFLMKNHEDGGVTLSDVLKQFVGTNQDRPDLKIIDISGLPNEVAGPLTASIGRLLFQYKLTQSSSERESDPILLVCEEAHRYVPSHGEAQYSSAQVSIRRIAREGRKYGMGLMLVSQRPADVEPTVLSQCNTWIVLRLSNSVDQAYVGRMLPDAMGGMLAQLSSLPRQEALFVGEGAAFPSRIRLKTLTADRLPRSEDISFAKGWHNDSLPPEAIGRIARRMSGRSIGDKAGDAAQT